MKTYWNGERCHAKKVIITVGDSPQTWWCHKYKGERRRAIEIIYGKETFYLDDEDGSGWTKVTLGKGSPQCPHASLPRDFSQPKEFIREKAKESDVSG